MGIHSLSCVFSSQILHAINLMVHLTLTKVKFNQLRVAVIIAENTWFHFFSCTFYLHLLYVMNLMVYLTHDVVKFAIKSAHHFFFFFWYMNLINASIDEFIRLELIFVIYKRSHWWIYQVGINFPQFGVTLSFGKRKTLNWLSLCLINETSFSRIFTFLFYKKASHSETPHTSLKIKNKKKEIVFHSIIAN